MFASLLCFFGFETEVVLFATVLSKDQCCNMQNAAKEEPSSVQLKRSVWETATQTLRVQENSE